MLIHNDLDAQPYNHYAKYEAIVKAIGPNCVGHYMPVSDDVIRRSTDPYLNDIPLNKWDVQAQFLPMPAVGRRKENGTIEPSGWSPSDRVCALKHYAIYYIQGRERPKE
jgi:hypothetical protein